MSIQGKGEQIRPREYRELVRALSDSQSGGAVVLGRTGIGKTTLVQELFSSTSQTPVMSLYCTPSQSTVPHSALSPYLAQLAQIEDPVLVLRELNRTIFSPEVQVSGQIILVENAQYLDAQSCFILTLLVENASVKIVAIGGDAIALNSPLSSLREATNLSSIVVNPLNIAGVREVAEAAADRRLSDGAIDMIMRASGGHPRLATTYVSACVEQGAFFLDNSLLHEQGVHEPIWVLTKPLPAINDPLRAVARESMRLFSPDEQDTLALIALGGPQSFEVLECCALPYRRLVDIGELLLEQKTLTFPSELMPFLIRSEISGQESARLHALATRGMDASGLKPTGPQIAWTLEIGVPVETTVVLQLVEQAIEDQDFVLALKLCSMGNLAQQHEWGALLETKVLIAIGRYRAARALLLRLVQQLTDINMLSKAFGFLVEVSAYIDGASGEHYSVLKSWEEGIAGHHDTAGAGISLLHQRAGHEFLELWGRFNSANGKQPEVEEFSEFLNNENLPVQARILAMISLTDRLSIAGQAHDAIEVGESTMRLLQQHPRLRALYEMRVYFRIGWNLLFAGEYQRAHDVIANYRGSHARSIQYFQGSVALLESLEDLLQGRLRRAIVKMAAAVTELRVLDSVQLLALAKNLYRLLARYLDVKLNISASKNVELNSLQALSGLHGHLGEESSAQRIFARAVATALGQPLGKDTLQDFPLIEREALFRHACQLNEDDLADSMITKRLEAIAAKHQGSRAALQVQLIRLRSSSASGPLEQLAQEALEEREYLIAVEALARAAQRHHEAGNQRRCGELLRRTAQILDEQRMDTGKELGHILALTELTAREAEIVDLARSGMNNSQIARVLTVSQRTVEGHLYRVFSKLGISERSEL